MSQTFQVLLFLVLVSNIYQDCLDESLSPLVQSELISHSVTSVQVIPCLERA